MNRTWESLEEMRRAITLMLQGNHYFAWQHVVNDDEGPRAPYYPCHDLSELTKFESDIFAGVKTPGFYSIRRDNKTRWGAIDFDDHENKGLQWEGIAASAFETLSRKFPETWLLKTHEQGFHVVPFTREPILASEMRRVLLEIAPEGVEVFPKQDKVKSDGMGSLLRFPGRHQLKGNWSEFLAHSGRIEVAEEKSHFEKQRYWQPPTEQQRLSSLYQVATRGIQPTGTGQRYNAMQRIAGRLKGRANEEDARKVYSQWHNRHAAKIKTPFAESLVAFLAWFRKADPCNTEIPDYPLTLQDEAFLSGTTNVPGVPLEALKEIVRLFLRAKKHADAKGLPEFWLSLKMIAAKLGVSVATACRYRDACVQKGIVRLIQRGYTGMASTYRLRE